MSIHINASADTIAKTVLLAGDPLRVEYITQRYLQDAQLVSCVRNACYFTGNYKGQRITVGTSGMGCPSMGIYSYELYTAHEVTTIIRIGTCGAYKNSLSLFDLLIAEISASESTYAVYAWGDTESIMLPAGSTTDLIQKTAETFMSKYNDIRVHKGKIHTSDAFYRSEKGIPAIAEKYQCDAVEMESFALFANAKHLKRNAAAILTVSDIISTQERITADQRERSLNPMIELALETAIKNS
jgi:purine-nucleoside phosphorylase